ncbi:hypothetical protein F5X97DRAFT_281217 [Nemania serpens]|nr:hypothetical protein F5X97DRAFT_281217 [Nemania serpens]
MVTWLLSPLSTPCSAARTSRPSRNRHMRRQAKPISTKHEPYHEQVDNKNIQSPWSRHPEPPSLMAMGCKPRTMISRSATPPPSISRPHGEGKRRETPDTPRSGNIMGSVEKAGYGGLHALTERAENRQPHWRPTPRTRVGHGVCLSTFSRNEQGITVMWDGGEADRLTQDRLADSLRIRQLSQACPC